MQDHAKVLYTIDPSLSLLYYVMAGSVELGDFFAYEQVARRDPLRRPDMKIIVDFTLASALSYELADIQRMIELNANLLAQGLPLERTAVIGRKAYDITAGEIINERAQLAVPIDMGVFLTLREAVEWLELGHAYEQIAGVQERLWRQVQVEE
jgi:hypothetical protein